MFYTNQYNIESLRSHIDVAIAISFGAGIACILRLVTCNINMLNAFNNHGIGISNISFILYMSYAMSHRPLG